LFALHGDGAAVCHRLPFAFGVADLETVELGIEILVRIPPWLVGHVADGGAWRGCGVKPAAVGPQPRVLALVEELPVALFDLVVDAAETADGGVAVDGEPVVHWLAVARGRELLRPVVKGVCVGSPRAVGVEDAVVAVFADAVAARVPPANGATGA